LVALAAVAALAAGGLLVAPSAHADTEVPNWVECQPGSPPPAGHIEQPPEVGNPVLVRGTVDACGTETFWRDFGLVVFYPDSVTTYVEHYRQEDNRFRFDLEVREGIQAVCLTTRESTGGAGPNERVDCVRTTWDPTSGGPVFGAHIGADDPLVGRPTGEFVRVPDPICVTCNW
jgi:hypothetical protein